MFDFPELGIRLRGFQGDKDLDQILAMYNDRELATFFTVGYIVPVAPAKVKEDFRKTIENNAEIFCVIESIPASEEDETEWIGFVALFGAIEWRLRRESSFSISIWKKYWNKGYGTAVTRFIVGYAFDSLFMHRIKLQVFEGNDRAVSVYKRCGFVLEGRERKALRPTGDGVWKDIICMGMIIDDWIEMKKKASDPSQACKCEYWQLSAFVIGLNTHFVDFRGEQSYQ